MVRGFLGLPWFVSAVLALLVAVVYTFVWPRKVVSETAGVRLPVMRWGHALTWCSGGRDRLFSIYIHVVCDEIGIPWPMLPAI